jgi:hypothetical protein
MNAIAITAESAANPTAGAFIVLELLGFGGSVRYLNYPKVGPFYLILNYRVMSTEQPPVLKASAASLP